MDKHNLKLIKNLGTCFGLGELPIAPGTFGTLGAIPIFFILSFIRKFFINNIMYNSFYFLFIVTLFAIAVYVSDVCERNL